MKLNSWAVDIGNFQTKFPLGDFGAADLIYDTFPSYAPVYLQGSAAEALGPLAAGHVLLVDAPRFVGSGVFNMLSGRDGARVFAEDFYRSSEYYALYLGALAHLAYHLGVEKQLEIDSVVGGLPVQASAATYEAVKVRMAGEHHLQFRGSDITVFVREANVTSQPKAVIRAMPEFGKKNTVAVLDMGGGTFDWFTSQGYAAHPDRCGSVAVGMNACVRAIATAINPSLKDNPRILVRIDEALRSNSTTVEIDGKEEDLTRHDALIQATIGDAVKRMVGSLGQISDLSVIQATGGGAPVLARVLKTQSPHLAQRLRINDNTHTEVVRGCHLMANGMARAARKASGAAA